MKILVTGCAGFIGFHLTKRLLLEGHEVVGVDNLNDYYDTTLKTDRLAQLRIDAYHMEENESVSNPATGFTFIKSSIESDTLYSKYLNRTNFDAVCHLAAQAGVRYSIDHPQQYISCNVQGFFNILEYVRYHPVKRFVFASSSSVYGKNTNVPYQESDTTDTPVSLYAATKKSNELFAHSYSELYGIHTIGLRFFSVYGPWGRPDMAPFLFTKAIIEGEAIKVFNKGDMSRDFTYIDDIIEGIYQVTTSEPTTDLPTNFNMYNIGNSKPVDLNKFIATIEKLTGKRAHKTLLPMQPGDVKQTWANTDLLHQHYNYAPSTPMEEGLHQFVEWYRSYYTKKASY